MMRYLILCLLLSGCGYRAPQTPDGMCVVTVRHSGPFCRDANTYGYGTRHGNYVLVPAKLLAIPFTRTMRTRYGPLDLQRRRKNYVPIWRRNGNR